jgi:hypothetical protein
LDFDDSDLIVVQQPNLKPFEYTEINSDHRVLIYEFCPLKLPPDAEDDIWDQVLAPLRHSAYRLEKDPVLQSFRDRPQLSSITYKPTTVEETSSGEVVNMEIESSTEKKSRFSRVSGLFRRRPSDSGQITTPVVGSKTRPAPQLELVGSPELMASSMTTGVNLIHSALTSNRPTLQPKDVHSFYLPSFSHERLPGPGWIRLLQLLPGEKSDILHGRVISVQQDSTRRPSYQALSYAWGQFKGYNSRIVCSGTQLNITDTLYDGLIQIRDAQKIVTLWADQVCINMEDLSERSHQIVMMRRIFGDADMVLVWLGVDELNLANTAFRTLLQILQPSQIQSSFYSISGLAMSDLMELTRLIWVSLFYNPVSINDFG